MLQVLFFFYWTDASVTQNCTFVNVITNSPALRVSLEVKGGCLQPCVYLILFPLYSKRVRSREVTFSVKTGSFTGVYGFETMLNQANKTTII